MRAKRHASFMSDWRRLGGFCALEASSSSTAARPRSWLAVNFTLCDEYGRTGCDGCGWHSVNSLQQHSWGLIELEIERELLSVGKFGLRRARGQFPDGTSFAMPDSDPLPMPLEIPSELRNQVVSLVVTWRKSLVVHAAGGQVSAGASPYPNPDRQSCNAQWRLQPADEFDAASRHSPPQSNPEFAQIPLAHIIECLPDKLIVLDDRFIPTVMICAAAPRLVAFLSELLALVHHRAESLAARGTASPRGGAAELADFLMLQSLNRYDPVIRQMAATAECHPEDLHRLALEMAGDMATFTTPSRRPAQFPAYRHDALRQSFGPVIEALRGSLSVVLGQSAVPVSLAQKRYGISVATVTDRTLLDTAVFVLAARAELATDELRRRLPGRLTIAPVEKIASLVNQHAGPGIAIHAMPVAPKQIPYHAGLAYFELDRTSTLWPALKSSVGIAIHTTGEFSGLSLELWAVRTEPSPAPTSDEARQPNAHGPGPTESRLTLEIAAGPDVAKLPSRSFSFGAYGGWIGRAPECDLILASPHVSRHHATIHWISGTYYIESKVKDGVAVNNPQTVLAQLERRALKNGDRVFIDQYEIRVSLGGDAPEVRQDPIDPAPAALGASDDELDPLARMASPRVLPAPLAAADRFNDEFRPAGAPRTQGEWTEPPTLPAAVLSIDENLQFTVYRPKQLIPEHWLPLLAFAHLAERPADADPMELDPIEEVAAQAEALLSQRIRDYRPIVQPAGQAVSRESDLTFVPRVEGLEFNPAQHSFVWKGSVQREVFLVRAGAEQAGRTLRGRLVVFLGSLVIAEVPLTIPIAAQARDDTPGQVVQMETARRYRKIFASYSHKDQSIVEEFEGYARALGDEYLRDVVSLRSGEVWNTRLQTLIANADVFQLFWSWNSMDSDFVRAEWEHAVGLGRPEFIRPVYWEDPLPCRPEKDLPPPSLQIVHFQRLPVRREGVGATPKPAAVRGQVREPGAQIADYWSHRVATDGRPLATGSVIKNRFVVEAQLGCGITGTVFKARDLRWEETGERNRWVAIKVFGEGFKRSLLFPADLQRWALEIRNLVHPNIVTMYELDCDAKHVFLVMELLEGEALDRLLEGARGSGLNTRTALRISRDICRAMAYAHRRGVVHTDFRPASAFLTREGVVKILDFGIVTAVKLSEERSDLTRPPRRGALSMRAPAYASCELMEGLEPDVRDDVYTIACVTYELLSGNHPYRGVMAVQAREAKLVAERPPGLSRTQWRALQKGLAFKRDERPIDVDALAKGLEPGWLSRLRGGTAW